MNIILLLIVQAFYTFAIYWKGYEDGYRKSYLQGYEDGVNFVREEE